MTKNLDKEGLSSIVDNYQLFYIDLWGVVHNGVTLHQEALKVLKEISNKGKEYILLTNAPRPNNVVKSFLEKMGMEKDARECVFTSGEASLNYIKKNLKNKKFFHVGPPRDFDLFNDFAKMKSNNIENSQYILCTGLFDDHDDDLEYYKNYLKKHTSKKLVCTNPDLIVHRGNEEELCAGSVAKVFEELGGESVYFGKPYKEVYKYCFSSNEKVLAIGDNLRTDIKGANNLNIDCIFISDGVHRDEYKDKIELDLLLKKYKVKANFFQKELKW